MEDLSLYHTRSAGAGIILASLVKIVRFHGGKADMILPKHAADRSAKRSK
jgi:hypothetical protein